MKRGTLLFLLIGMWTSTQINVIGFLGISELVIYLIAPYVYLKNRMLYKRDGLGVLFVLLFLTMISCWVSGFYNHAGLIPTLKGFASIYAVFSCVAVLYPMLRKKPDGLSWFLVGLAISSIICIFIFQPGSAHMGVDAGKTEIAREDLQASVTGYALFWIAMINRWTSLPIRAFYFAVPSWYCILVPFATSCYALLSSASGRSSFICGMFCVVLLTMGGKSYRSLSRLRRNFISVLIVIGVSGLAFAYVYKYTAKTGLLGEDAQHKYERQIAGGSHGEGILGMLMGSRLEIFIGATACLKHPVLGCGSLAIDKEGLVEYFYAKYGSHEEFEDYLKTRAMRASAGIYYQKIPAHSHIISYWMYYGIFGGIFWVYVLYVMVKTLKNYMTAIPQWFGYFAMVLPGMAMAVFFSPFGDRVEKSVMICCCFIAKNVYEHRIRLPPKMIQEAIKKSH